MWMAWSPNLDLSYEKSLGFGLPIKRLHFVAVDALFFRSGCCGARWRGRSGEVI
jgi:hypothetical protein